MGTQLSDGAAPESALDQFSFAGQSGAQRATIANLSSAVTHCVNEFSKTVDKPTKKHYNINRQGDQPITAVPVKRFWLKE